MNLPGITFGSPKKRVDTNFIQRDDIETHKTQTMTTTESYKMVIMDISDNGSEEFEDKLRDLGPDAFPAQEVFTNEYTYIKQGEASFIKKSNTQRNMQLFCWNPMKRKWVLRTNVNQEL